MTVQFQNFSVNSSAPPPIALAITTTTPLPAGNLNTAYTGNVSATGGKPGYTFTISAGALPTGLVLATNGGISGTPTATGVFTPTFLVTDSVGGTATLPASMTILETPATATFSDNFNRANTALGLGANWFGLRPNPNVAGAYSDCRITGNQYVSFLSAAGDSNPGTTWYPEPILSTLWGVTQYAQITFTAITVTLFPRSGLAVMITPNEILTQFTAYTMAQETAIAYSLNLRNAGAFLPLGGPYVNAIGDIMKLHVTPTAGNNTIRIYKNAVLIDTVVDASAGRPVLTGVPGFYNFNGLGDTTSFDDFSCGRG